MNNCTPVKPVCRTSSSYRTVTATDNTVNNLNTNISILQNGLADLQNNTFKLTPGTGVIISPLTPQSINNNREWTISIDASQIRSTYAFANSYFDNNQSGSFTALASRINDTIYGLLDNNTSEEVTFSKVVTKPDNNPYTNNDIDGVIVVKKGNEFFKRNERVTVRNFGAKLDGITNDLPVLQKAIDTLSIYGMDIEIPEGTLYLNDAQGGISLPINKPTTIKGAGIGKTIVKLSSLTPRFADLNVQGLQNQTFKDIVISDLTIDANNVDDTVTGQDTFEHIILGNQTRISDTGINSSTTVVFIKNILVENVNVINAPISPVASLEAPRTCIRWGISIEVWGVGSKIENFRAKNVSINGADCGIVLNGRTGTFIDEVHLEDCFHDCGVPSATNYPAINYMVAGESYIGRVTMTNVVGKNSGDVGIEVDNAQFVSLTNVRIEDAYGANYYFENYESPAKTVDGPPTTTISNSGGINSSATTITVPSVPKNIDTTGFLRIGSELIYYSIVNSTTLNIIRGFNNSTAASHAQNAKITFHESGKQQIILTNCVSRRNQGVHGSGIELLTSQFLPLPNLIVRNFSHERSGNNVEQIGEALLIDGFISKVDIDGFSANLSGDITNQNSVIFLGAPSTYLHTDPIIKKSLIRIKNTDLTVSGKSTGAGTNFIGVHGGSYDFDIDMTVNGNIKGSNSTTRGVAVGYYSADQVQGKIKLKMINTPNGDLSPIPVLIDYLGVINNSLELDLDLSQMWFSATSNWSNYNPYVTALDSPSALINLKKIQHSYIYSDVVSSELIKGTIISGNYNLKLSDKYIGVDTNNTTNIVLPKMGGSFNRSPVVGFETTIKDEIGLAATHNITITPFSGELIEGVSSKVINYAYGQVKLRWNGNKWMILQNTSVLAGVNNNILPKSNGTNLIPSALSESDVILNSSLPFRVSGNSNAELILTHTGAGVDAKNWEFFAVGNRVVLRLINDDFSAGTDIFFAQRSGMTGQLVNFNVPVTGVASANPDSFVLYSQLSDAIANTASTFSDNGFTI